MNVRYDTTKKLAHLDEYLRTYWTDFCSLFALRADDGSVPNFPILQGKLPWQPNNFAKILSTSTGITCIRCTSASKRIVISWSSCVR